MKNQTHFSWVIKNLRDIHLKKNKVTIHSSQESYTVELFSKCYHIQSKEDITLYSSQKTEGCSKMRNKKSCTATESCASKALCNTFKYQLFPD